MSGFEFPLPNNENNEGWPPGFEGGLGEQLQAVAQDIPVARDGGYGISISMEGGAMIGVSYEEDADLGQKYHVAFYPADQDAQSGGGVERLLRDITQQAQERDIFTDDPDEVMLAVRGIINDIAGQV